MLEQENISTLPLPGDDPRILTSWYDAMSEGYDELYGDEQAEKHSKVLQVIGNRRFDLLVDVGCGTGRLLSLLSSMTEVSIGIDVSSRMLTRARQNLKGLSTQFVRADAAHLPLQDRLADGVTSVSVAKTGPDLQEQLGELSRIAKTNSAIVITILEEDSQALSEDLKLAGMRVAAKLSDRERLCLADHTQ